MKKYIGIDIGGTNIRIGLINNEFNLESFTLFKVEEINDFFKFFYYELLKMVNDHSIEFISIGIPGTFDSYSKMLINTPNINLDKDIFLKLEEKLEKPIYLTNDANALLMEHIRLYNIKDENVLGFYVGTGFGSAIYINNKIYTGAGKAGEIGHTKVLGNNLQCGCGKRGCLETLVSGSRLHQISQLYSYIKFDQLFNHLHEIQELNQFIDLLAFTIANKVLYFDVNNIVLGGGVINRKDFPLPLLESKIYKLTDPKNINIHISKTNDQDGIKGSVLLSLQK